MFNSLLKKLKPYVAGEQPSNKAYIKLNTNESPYSPSPLTMEAIKDARGLRLYPDPNASVLKKALAEMLNVRESNLFIGNGSDEVLAFLFLALFESGGGEEIQSASFNNKGIASLDVTYSFYPVYANLFGVKFKEIPLKIDMTVDVERLKKADAEGIVIANPNAPTGISLAKEDIMKIVREKPERLVVVDEAYIDFGGESVIAEIENNKNLIVVRTFSKAYSLAGLRVGYAVADESVISALETVKNSFNSYTVGSISQAVATCACKEKAYYLENAKRTTEIREKTAAALAKIGYQSLPSNANFLFVQCEKGGKAAYEYLKSQGILVRHFPAPRTDFYIRITIGTESDMAALIAALKKFN